MTTYLLTACYGAVGGAFCMWVVLHLAGWRKFRAGPLCQGCNHPWSWHQTVSRSCSASCYCKRYHGLEPGDTPKKARR